jgi:predicted TIM-barrel fold metal-dependent hydrolase
MNSPWGEIPVHDAHVHFFSHSFFTALAAQRGAGDSAAGLGQILGWQVPSPGDERLAETWALELDRHHVAKAALIASLPGDEDSVAAAVAHLPTRFYGYFMVNPLAPDAEARVEAALSRKGLRGVCLFPAMQGYSVHDPRVRPILDLAAARPGCVVFVHCGVLSVGVRRKLGLPSPFDMRFSNPVDLHAIALRYPKLPFVVPHFGAGYFREALMLCDLCPNVYLDTSSSNAWTRYEPSHADLKTVFRHALEIAGPGRLLFGSDSSFFPRGWHSAIFETQSRALYEMGLSSSDARLIFGENLARLLT